jgi:arylsulfatase A-like enzyme
VTSVHGDMHGAHGCFRKGWPYEESVRVPLLVRRPGMAPRCDRSAISLSDLPRLALAWADGVADEALPRSEVAAMAMPSVVALPGQCDRVWRGVRSPTRKLVLNADGSPWLFFDLERDPFERENLAGQAAARAELAAWQARCHALT